MVADESVAGSTVNHRGVGGTIRWMAPEVMYPEMFGFTGEHRKRLPSRSTDIYALGMTILEVMPFVSPLPPIEMLNGSVQVITGCHPFDSTIRDAAVMYRVLEGGRPNRPPSGFSDRLWELLANTWCVEYGSQPSKRPSATTVLHLLKGEPHNWGKSMIPPQLVQPQNRCRCSTYLGYDILDSRLYVVEDAGTVMDGRSDSEDGGKFFILDRISRPGADMGVKDPTTLKRTRSPSPLLPPFIHLKPTPTGQGSQTMPRGRSGVSSVDF